MTALAIAAVAVIIISIYLHQLQAMLPVAAALLALRIYLLSFDPNVRRVAGVLAFAFSASTLSNIAWFLVPTFVNDPLVQTDNYYYITGMFWLFGYVAIAYTLLRLKNSRQWYLERGLDRAITAAGVGLFLLVSLYVFLKIDWSSSHVIDIFLLLAYLCIDIIILTTAVKLSIMLRAGELRFLVASIMVFFATNAIGDLLYETRWLFKLSKLMTASLGRVELSFHFVDVTDLIYNGALLFMTGFLFMYVIGPYRNRAMDEIRGRLKEAQLFVDDFIAKSPDATCIFDRGGRLVLVNDAFLQVFGLKRQNVDPSFNIFSHIRNLVLDDVQKGLLKVGGRETVIIPRMKIRGTQGGRKEDFYIYLKIFPTYTAGGQIANYVMIIEDITDRHLAEEALKASERRNAALVDAIPDTMYVLSTEGNILDYMAHDRSLLTDPMGQAVGKNIRDAGFDPETIPVILQYVKMAIETRLLQQFEHELVVPAGRRSFEARMTALTDREVLCIWRDITERKRAAEALRESEEKFRMFAETSPAAIIIYQEGGIIYANPAAESISGYRVEELIGKKLTEIVLPEYRREVEERVSQRMQGLQLPTRLDVRIVTKDGRERWVSNSTVTINYKNKPAGLVVVIDITDRKEAEEALLKSEALFRTLSESSLNGIVVYQDEMIVYANPAAVNISGYLLDELLQMKFWDIMHPSIRDQVRETGFRMMKGEVIASTNELKIVRKGGEERWVNASSARVEYQGSPAVLMTVMDITERKRAEEALRESEASLARAQAIAHLGSWEWDINNGRGWWSDELYNIYGVKKADFKLNNQNVFGMIHPDDRTCIESLLYAALQDGKPYSFDFRIIRPNGIVRTLHCDGEVTYDKGRVTAKLIGTSQDITERMRAEEALRDSEARLQAFIANSEVIGWMKDEDGRYVFVSQNYERRFNTRSEDWMGKTDFERWPPDIADKFRENDLKVIESGQSCEVSEEAVNPDGSKSIWLSFKFPFRDAGGKRYVGGLAVDITERKRAEAALRESEEKFRALTEMAPVAISILQDGRFKYANPAMEKISGYSLAELLGVNFLDMVHPDYREYFAGRHRDWLKGDIQGVLRNRLMGVRKDGKVCWVDLSLKPIEYQGRPALLLTGIDITERKLAEEALRESEASLAKAQAIAHLGSWEWDIQTNKGWWSDELYRIYGLDKASFAPSYEAFLGRVHPDDRARVDRSMSATLHDGKPYTLDFRIVRPDGSERTIHSEGELAYDKDGKPVNMVGIGQDITERVRLEQQLFHAYDSLKAEFERKMDFTNAAAHELRTPLTPIIGYTDILKAEVKDERHRKFLGIIERNARRQKKMVDSMLELASLDAGMMQVRKAWFPVLPLASEIADNYRSVNPNISLEVPRDLQLYTDPDILRHILDNLVSNAVKYSQYDRDVEIRAIDAGHAYQFSVRDRGPGIPADEWGKIFERFYIVGGDRDNRTGGRIGLGLALVRAYVHLIGGRVWLESEPGLGSTFFFTVPKVQ